MGKKKLLRLISIVMFIIAAIFVCCAVSYPEIGHVFYIGSIRIDAEIKHVFYACYGIVTVLLLVASFL